MRKHPIYLGNMENKKRIPKVKRDTSSDKKRIKKILLIVISSLLVLALLSCVLPLVLEHIQGGGDDVSYADYRFFEADYSKNILEDELYLSHNRSIRYNRYGSEQILTESNVTEISESAVFFYDYFNCIINGDYESYPSYFTASCLADEDMTIPEKFTMQGLYDIQVTLHSVAGVEETDTVSEIYEVSYRIFENNGTFRSDILPDETRTLVFELYITNGVAKINAIGYRRNAE